MKADIAYSYHCCDDFAPNYRTLVERVWGDVFKQLQFCPWCGLKIEHSSLRIDAKTPMSADAENPKPYLLNKITTFDKFGRPSLMERKEEIEFPHREIKQA